ncbi:MAG: gamma-glutamyl-gamma-aminobutyrate hydrolase family protein, partial [Eubacteriales bacterium]|nr:gamma-glutamyl-gamma-aminobutyrate hydrolase family protein [Eubacteriales bacterium]
LEHPRNDVPRDYAHSMSLVSGTMLRSIYGADEIQVNSRHHQGIKTLAPGLKINAVAPDRLIEGVEFADGRPLLAVQWHPESLQDRYPEHRAPFDWLIREASR